MEELLERLLDEQKKTNEWLQVIASNSEPKGSISITTGLKSQNSDSGSQE